MSDRPEFGLGAGKVYPASRAALLLNPLRRLIQPPRRIVTDVGLGPGDRVLELGCGPGWFSRDLAAAVPEGQLLMVDLQPEMLRRAGRRLRRSAGAGASRLCADATALPLRRASVDAVFVSAVLGEVPDRGAALAEVARVLRPDGRVAVVETRTDPDFIPLAELCEAFAEQELVLEHERTGRSQYVARFRSAGA